MKILMVDAFGRGNFSTRWRTYCAGRGLAARGHEATYWHLTRQPHDVPGLARRPRRLQPMVIRLLMALRAFRVPALARRAGQVIVLDAYTSRWLACWRARRVSGFVSETVDFANNADCTRLHCPAGWRGALMRWRMRRSYGTFFTYVDAARLVCTNNDHCSEQAAARGKPVHLLFDPLPSAYLSPVAKMAAHGPVCVGWCGHPATCHDMQEVREILRAFTSSGRVTIELMEGSAEIAEAAGAQIIPWTEVNFTHRVPRWDVGIAPLPAHVEGKGKTSGKILQYMLDPATRASRRPWRAYARGVKGQRGRCPSHELVGKSLRRAAGLGGLMPARHKGSEAAAPPRLCC